MNCIIFVETQTPIITPEVVSPLTPEEGKPVTFNWTYDLRGQSFQQMVFTKQGIFRIVQQFFTSQLSFEDGFQDRVRVDFNVTHSSYASFTFLAVHRNDSNPSYTLTLQNAKGISTSPGVKLDVRCK